MSQGTKARGSALNLVPNCALLLCLLAPSAWMIANIPPLWRDVDAYNQLAKDPLVSTFWGHGPAYSYLAKIPLFLGEQLERWQGIGVAGGEGGSPALTDTGVGLLILLQHLALGGGAFYFIGSISNSFWVRLGLALLWASNALFYTFAHCIGSETLSLFALVLLAAMGLRLIRSRRHPEWTDWYLFAITLVLCLLSRHINGLLILLLPVTFLLCWTHHRFASVLGSSERERRRRRWIGSRQLGQAVIAIAIGVASVAVANSLTHYLARKTKFHPHSRLGYTMMWRLQFLQTLPPSERAALLQEVAARAGSSETRRLLTLLGQMHEEGAGVMASVFMQRAAALLFPGQAPVPWEKLDLAVNEMAYAFLLPPTKQHWHAAKTDFAAALKMSLTAIPDQLFDTTGYYFDHKDEMPACAKLVTFRDFSSAAALNRIPAERAYFHLWQGLNYERAVALWFGALLVFLMIARSKKANAGAIAAFGIALLAIGLVMMASTCLLSEFLPRYAMPMWLLLLLSLSIIIGTAADLLATSKEKSAGQLPRLG